MDEMTSSEFRKRYASLEQETNVTVNGHLIGRWVPAEQVRALGAAVRAGQTILRDAEKRDHAFNSQPFRPVPKRSAK